MTSAFERACINAGSAMDMTGDAISNQLTGVKRYPIQKQLRTEGVNYKKEYEKLLRLLKNSKILRSR